MPCSCLLHGSVTPPAWGASPCWGRGSLESCSTSARRSLRGLPVPSVRPLPFPACLAGGSPCPPRPAFLFQGALDPGEGSDPCLDTPDDVDVLRTRHSRHTRKRRRLL